MHPLVLPEDYSKDKYLICKITMWPRAEGDYHCHWRYSVRTSKEP